MSKERAGLFEAMPGGKRSQVFHKWGRVTDTRALICS